MIAVIAAFTAGALTWTLLEYVLHRWAGHALKGKIHFSREHLRHHAVFGYFTPNGQKVAAALATAGLALLATVPWLGPWVGAAYTVGLVGMYLVYEAVHRTLHVAAPASAYGRWARAHHFAHHFTDARMNHGVTSPLWDLVFRTRLAPHTIAVPRKHAMRWLLTPEGEVHPDWRPSYTLRA